MFFCAKRKQIFWFQMSKLLAWNWFYVDSLFLQQYMNKEGNAIFSKFISSWVVAHDLLETFHRIPSSLQIYL